MTKKQITLYLIVILIGSLFTIISGSVIASSSCGNLKACENKFCEIERQIKIALEKGNKHKADGLEKALKNAKGHCTDKGLKEDLVEEIEEANKEIVEYESDLKEAKEYGKKDKVHKYQEKIREEKEKINRLENELSNLN